MTQPITTEARKSAIAAAAAAAETAVKAGQGTAEELRWKGSSKVLPVASVDVDLVLLSPHSHRIKAQLQSLVQSEQDVVSSDPFGSQAQAIIARLLTATPGFERIKKTLQNDGQQHAGVITTAGVLINANTRTVALRALRERYVKVIVLPEDAGPKEITALELRLQMEQSIKQEYSFTSGLLFIEDLVTSGYTLAEIGRALRPDLGTSVRDQKKATENVEGELRLLGLIREVLTTSGGVMKFLDFDENRQALIDIDQDYQRQRTQNPAEAARVRDAQLAAMIAGVDYRRLREIDTSLLDTYVAPALQESDVLAPYLGALLTPATHGGTNAPAGLDLLDDDDQMDATSGSDSLDLTALYTLLATTKADEEITLTSDGGSPVSLSRKSVAAEIYGALSTAIDTKKRDSRQVDDLTAPTAHLKEATRTLDKATAAYGSVHELEGFDRGAFLTALQGFQRAAAEFLTATASESDTVTRSTSDPVAEDAGA